MTGARLITPLDPGTRSRIRFMKPERIGAKLDGDGVDTAAPKLSGDPTWSKPEKAGLGRHHQAGPARHHLQSWPMRWWALTPAATD